MTEYRNSGTAVVKVADAKKHQVITDVCPYNVVDEYRTRWIPGVWTASLEQRKPPMVWAHKWEEPIGHMIDADDSPTRLRTVHQLDDFDAVPRARQAWAQFESGTLTDASFGFSRSKDRPAEDEEGVYDILEARMDEVSPVLVGAVPGAKHVGTRGLPAEAVLDMARHLEAGNMSLDAALDLVRSFSGSQEQRAVHSHAKQGGEGHVNHSHSGDNGMHAHSGLMPAVMGRAAPSTTDPEDVPCPKCGALNETDAMFCDQCGASMGSPTNSEPSGRSTMAESEARDLLATLGRH